MALVTVTGNAWQMDQQPISSGLEPELWFRPLATSLAHGLLSSREVKATLERATGSFSVQLESHPKLLYVPVMRWLVPATSGNESMENRARGYDEWPMIHPGSGGDISELNPEVGLYGLLYGFGAPPQRLERVVYLDITGPAIRIYGPAGALVEG